MDDWENNTLKTIQKIKSFNSVLSGFEKWDSISKVMPAINAWERLNQNGVMDSFMKNQNAIINSSTAMMASRTHNEINATRNIPSIFNETLIPSHYSSTLGSTLLNLEASSAFSNMMSFSPIIGNVVAGLKNTSTLSATINAIGFSSLGKTITDIKQSSVFNQFVNRSGFASKFGKTFLDPNEISLFENFKHHNHFFKLNLDYQIGTVFDSIRHNYLVDDEMTVDYIENEFKNIIDRTWTDKFKDNSASSLLNQLFINLPRNKLSWEQWAYILKLIISIVAIITSMANQINIDIDIDINNKTIHNNTTINNNTTIINNACDVLPKE